MVLRPLLLDSIAPSTSTFSPHGAMVQLNNFGMNRSATAIGHDQAIEAKRHGGAALDLAGHINLRDVAIHPRVPVLARVNHGCTERIAPPLRR